MPADALATLGARASAGMVLTPKPEYSVSSNRRVNIVYIDGLVQDSNNSLAVSALSKSLLGYIFVI